MAAAAPLSSEPTTPFWLTCLGAGLFLLGGLFLVFRSPAPVRPEKDKPVAAAAEPSARVPALPASLAGAAQRLDPEAAKRLQDRLRQAAPPGSPGANLARPGQGAAPPGGH